MDKRPDCAMNRLIDEYDMLPPGCTVVCAVSGGADSICLLHRLNQLRAIRPFTLVAAHYNHHLRGAESDRDEAFVKRWVEDWCGPDPAAGQPPLPAVRLITGGGDVSGEAKRLGLGLEETARRMRYAFLEEAARAVGADRIATAHTADDNAETVLLHLIRGSGLQGLTGIRPRHGRLVRPLLTTTRREIEDYLELYHIPHVEDSTNQDDAYTRNQVRHQVIPLLDEINPWFVPRMADTIRYLRSDNDYLSAQAAAVARRSRPAGDGGLSISAALLASQPDPIAVRIVSCLLGRLGEFQFRAAHLTAVVALSRSPAPSGAVSLPHSLTARRVYGELILVRGARRSPPFAPVSLSVPGEAVLPSIGWTIACRRAEAPEQPPDTPDHFFLNPSRLTGPLVIRPRLTGDTITLPRRRAKTVKKLLIDAKVPRWDRDRLPLLADASGPLWLAGFGPDQGRLSSSGAPALEVIALRTAPAEELQNE
ncbi:tRNA lysidine(34) synthetase TilS [Intestinimonas butyriciproducens]|uniref:tRNA lysidine(34) synthetase TilS n=1 Tax=Intestinimonas butyriciproducens TaxID=1297617 RepID=UPI001FAE6EB7|nr:tRNA lysidine(34) synthetase TilS [Intestinimonas butyriciproducens]MDB7818004.1 tRNA lysidine(34) synthetase TilS [Intestinimonas butyriciproducens]MDB7844459.1 tRNA lysidine(34) synthetase TilS [Intestinimonas butyriciproducens]MDB7858940.1 tRNA lysidine(34) synthetase TilS [Intestinimonas butyriciproducens]